MDNSDPISQHLTLKLRDLEHSEQPATLFNKLQIYDQVLSQYSLKPNDISAIKIFQQILTQQVNSYFQPSPNIKMFNSPPQKKILNQQKRYSIEDPQQFSFSKTHFNNKLELERQMGSQEPRVDHSPQQFNFNHYSEKIKAIHQQYSSKTREKKKNYGGRPRRVSEFMGEEKGQILQEKNYTIVKDKQKDASQEPLHKKSEKLKRLLFLNRFLELTKILKQEIMDRRMSLNYQSAIYFYQLKSLKKAFVALRSYGSTIKQNIEKFKAHRNLSATEQYFEAWREYAFRSQEERMSEITLMKSREKVMKMLGMKKFVQNCRIIMYDNQNDMKSRPEQKIKKSQVLKCKLQEVKNLRNYYQSKFVIDNLKQIHEERICFQKQKTDISKLIKQNQGRVLLKLLQHFQQRQEHKNNILCNQIQKRIFSKTVISKLQGYYHFQKVYWKDPNPNKQISIFQTSPQLESSSKIVRYSSLLPPKYQKIILINQILSCVETSLFRKGYIYQQDLYTTAPQYQSHPAVVQYLNPYIKRKYFGSLKKMVEERKQKQKFIKYQIIGKSQVIYPMLSWFKDHIKYKLDNQYMSLKKQQLGQLLLIGRSHNFIQCIQKNWKHSLILSHQKQITQRLKEKKVEKVFRYLKSKKTGKKFYVERIQAFMERSRLNFKERIFLEWKLHYMRNMHTQYMVISLVEARRRIHLGKLFENHHERSLQNIIFEKRIKWIQKNTILREGNQFLKNLQQNRKNMKKQKLYYEKGVSLPNTLKKTLNQRKALHFLELLKEFRNLKKETKFIEKEILPMYYEDKVKFRVFVSLIKIRQVEREEKRRVEVIKSRKKVSTQKKIMSVMVKKLLMSILLKRMCRTISRINKRTAFSTFSMLLEQQPQNIHNEY